MNASENKKSQHPFHEPKDTSMDIPIQGPEPDKVSCPLCTKTFKTKSEMERHKENQHKTH